LILEETLTADSLAKDEIDCQNLKFSGSRLRPAVASAAEYNTVIVVVVIVELVERFEVGDTRGQSFSNGIYLWRWKVLGPYILEGDVSCPNLDAIDRRKHNSARVPYLEYFYRNYTDYPRCIWDEQILVK
jgi:hypothetical protein